MENTTFLSTLGIFIGLLFVGLAIPLIKKVVPMNGFYGARFPQSYKSKQNWYEINAYSGKTLVFSSVPIFITSIYGLISQTTSDLFQWIWCIVLFASIFISLILSFIKAIQIDKKNAQQGA